MAIGTLLALSIGSALAGAIGGVVSARSQQQTNLENSAEAQANRDWQTMMSNTAHQREVADLKAAGLNPWLSVSGSGAPVTSGSTARQESVGDYGLSSIASSLQSLAFMSALESRGSTASQSRIEAARLAANSRTAAAITSGHYKIKNTKLWLANRNMHW